MKYEITETDTFGGEANFSWVSRYEIELPSNATDLQIARAVKRATGWNGVSGKSYWLGDEYTFYPYGECVVVFANFKEGE